ncbi:MAG TPA: two-component regulator propeller domain-containing protein, partial [Ginsengibacter sp.]
GYIWISTSKGLYRYDGISFKNFLNQSGKEDALLKNNLNCLTIDNTGIIWTGTVEAGIEKFDPSTNSFTSFQHNKHDASSLNNDTIICITTDHLNNIWIGTINGLDKLDRRSGKFIHYAMDKNTTANPNTSVIYTIYEDKQGIIWAGYIDPLDTSAKKKSIGGLNYLDPATRKFTRFFNNSNYNNRFINDIVFSIFEDSKKNLWLGMLHNDLEMLDRKTGKFTRFPFDSTTFEKADNSDFDRVTFITEDKMGYIWVGSFLHGISRYNLSLNKKMQYGGEPITGGGTYLNKDTLSDFMNWNATSGFSSKDGTFWAGTGEGDLYKLIVPHTNIPYFNLQAGTNSFWEQNDSILWIATSTKGLDRRNIKTGKDTWITNKNGNQNMPPDHDIPILRSDADSNLWIGTYTGLYKLNLRNNLFSKYLHDDQNSNSPSCDSILCLDIDKQNIWMGTYGHGLDKMNIITGNYKHFIYNKNDSTGIINNSISCITEDRNNDVWIGTLKGVDRLNQTTNKFSHYLKQSEVLSICVDAGGEVWAGTTSGFYHFDVIKNSFTEYVNYNSPVKIANVLHILEDNQHNFWLTTANAILKIDRPHNTISVFGKDYGVHYNNLYYCDNYKLKNGQLLIGDQNGYYLITPAALQLRKTIFLNLSDLKINDQEIEPGQNSVLHTTIDYAKEIKLNYKQNTFSFDFNATDYANMSETKYLYMLENYDNTWRDIGTEHKVYFFNVPPGKYVLHLKAISPDGVWAEKNLSIIISPPWWRTWWAYIIFALVFIGIVWSFIHYRSVRLRRQNKLLEEKVNHRTEQLKRSLEELKSTQAQLIQSEKMASLGELTAGIAHEIQNPLNFVNNFSEVNTELITELEEEADKGNIDEVKAIANDIKANEEKINHHGKRADAIVKNMLQHSRSSTGVKEPTDINALADEYLRLSYHGMRAKDKTFNANMQTNFDNGIGKINIIPQDIGRVLLNLFNNAFYAVNEKKKNADETYQPTVIVQTKKIDNNIEIRVSDNGNGIPQKVVDKIFQPFFTTKPTGEGTGLGLSLSYDIIKAHGGEIKVETKENEGTTFIIQLPINNA